MSSLSPRGIALHSPIVSDRCLRDQIAYPLFNHNFQGTMTDKRLVVRVVVGFPSMV